MSAAFGDFAPLLTAQADKPIVLLCAGIGITPMLSVLNTLVEVGSPRKVLFAHAVRAREQLLFTNELRTAQAKLQGLRVRLFSEELATGSGAEIQPGRMLLTPALRQGFEDADYFLCGPELFMREQFHSLVELGVSPLRIQREVFGPALLEHLA